MVSTSAIQCVCLVLLLVTINKVQAQSKVYNVLEHGAVADGKFDNSKVCTSINYLHDYGQSAFTVLFAY